MKNLLFSAFFCSALLFISTSGNSWCFFVCVFLKCFPVVAVVVDFAKVLPNPSDRAGFSEGMGDDQGAWPLAPEGDGVSGEFFSWVICERIYCRPF